jgi:hypothetical protein
LKYVKQIGEASESPLELECEVFRCRLSRQHGVLRTERRTTMSNTPQPPDSSKDFKHVCTICAQPSEKTICDACADKIRSDALARKKHEEKGD